MTHDCQCHSGRRRLRIRFAAAGAVPAVVHTAAAKLGWEPVADGRSFDLDIGGGARFSSPAELAVYLREIAAEAFDETDALWLDGEGRPAEPLSKNLAGFDANPLYALLEERRLATWFQPVFDRDLRVWGYECLVRAHDADGELITSDRLIGWARDENLLFYFDRICRETHVANAAVAQAPADARFLINFLPTTIYEPTVCLRTTLKAVDQAGLARERVIFEVVESEKIEDAAHLRRILDHYRESGFGVALDDLGTGHSGLFLLAELEPDLIKLDRELVARVVDSRIHRSICRSIIDLGREEGKLVLAEGIETAGQHAMLRELGADLFQGFYLGRPAAEPALSASID